MPFSSSFRAARISRTVHTWTRPSSLRPVKNRASTLRSVWVSWFVVVIYLVTSMWFHRVANSSHPLSRLLDHCWIDQRYNRRGNCKSRPKCVEILVTVHVDRSEPDCLDQFSSGCQA